MDRLVSPAITNLCRSTQRWTHGAGGLQAGSRPDAGSRESGRLNSAPCGDAPRGEQRIPAEFRALHHKTTAKCAPLHRRLTVRKPDFQTDAHATVTDVLGGSIYSLCDGFQWGQRDENAFFCIPFDAHPPVILSCAAENEKDKKMLARCCRGKVSVWAGVCVLVLCWFYVFPGYRLPGDKEIVDEVLRQGEAWQKNQTGIDLYRSVPAPAH